VIAISAVVMPVAAYRERYGVTIGLPTVVGRQGAAGELEPSMSEHERRAFERSAATLRDAARRIGVPSG
jgi:L-lactate dehydrogenase